MVEQELETPQRSYGVNPLFAKYFNTDAPTENALKEFKYGKKSKCKPLKPRNKSSKTLPQKPQSKDQGMTKPPPAATDRGGYNESCLI